MKLKVDSNGFELYQLSNRTIVLRPKQQKQYKQEGKGNKYGPQVPAAINQQQEFIKHINNLENIDKQCMPSLTPQSADKFSMPQMPQMPQFPPQQMQGINILNTYARQNDIPYDFYSNYGLCLLICKNYSVLEQNQEKIMPYLGNYFNHCFCFVEQSNLIQFINKYPQSIKKQIYGVIAANDVEQVDVITILYNIDKQFIFSGQSVEQLIAYLSNNQ